MPTPYVDDDKAVVPIAPSALTRLAYVEAAIDLQVRPVVASVESATRVATTVRPLVIVAEMGAGLTSSELTDLAVSVGAQLVIANEIEPGSALTERVLLAGKAARSLRSRSPQVQP